MGKNMSDFETHPIGTKAELERLQASNALLEEVAKAAKPIIDERSSYVRKPLRRALWVALSKLEEQT